MITPSNSFIEFVEAGGRKSKACSSFPRTDLELYGVKDITEFTFCFLIADQEGNSFSTEPLLLPTSLYDKKIQQTELKINSIINKDYITKNGAEIQYFSETPLYQDNEVCICSSFVVKNSRNQNYVSIEIMNTSLEPVIIYFGYYSVNGLKINDEYKLYSILTPGKHVFIPIFLEQELGEDRIEIFGIKEISDFQFSISVNKMFHKEISDPISLCIKTEKDSVPFRSSGEVLYEKDGLKITHKALLTGHPAFIDDGSVYWTMLVENDTSEALSLGYINASAYLNGKEVYISCNEMIIHAGDSTWYEIPIMAEALEELSITKISDITNIKLDLSVKNENKEEIAVVELKKEEKQ